MNQLFFGVEIHSSRALIDRDEYLRSLAILPIHCILYVFQIRYMSMNKTENVDVGRYISKYERHWLSSSCVLFLFFYGFFAAYYVV